jgi:hypothetical protein
MTLMRRAAFCALLVLVCAGLGSGGARADALSVNDILGRWCGETSDYEFTPERLTVHFHRGGEERVLPVRSFEVRSDEIKVHWDIKRPDLPADEIATVFNEFDPARGTMAQKPNTGGDKGGRLPFHRC